MAYLSYHLHWDHDDLMDLEHRDRRAWAREVSAINERANAESERSSA